MLLMLGAMAARAHDISGTWQGGDESRHVLNVRKSASGFRGDFYNLGEEIPGNPRNGNTISVVAVTDGAVRFTLDKTGGIFEGKLADDGKTIAGTWKTTFGPPQPLIFTRATRQTAWVIDPSPHKTIFVTVQPGVKLEVLDWGGSGRPLIFLSGLTATGHAYDTLAPKFTVGHHVYAITRRGFGASDAPAFTNENYDADRLGDDVLAVMDALKIDHPVLAGQSIAGEELSSVGTHHPERIAGLVYIDAIFPYSFYNPALGDQSVDAAVVRRDLDQLLELQFSPAKTLALVAEIQATLPRLQTAMKQMAEDYQGQPEMAHVQDQEDLAGNRIFTNVRRYGAIKLPILAVIPVPPRCQPNCDKPFWQKRALLDAAKADFFETSNPGARVVRLPQAGHIVWLTNEADVLQEMNGFMDGLPKP